MDASEHIIKEKDCLILDVNGKQTFLIVRPKSKVRVGASMCNVMGLIGLRFGSMLRVSEDGTSLEATNYVPADDWKAIDEDTTDNRNKNIVAAAQNQELTKYEIEEMKAAGTAGTEIIDALTSKSSTFALKTTYAQEKYKKRKAKKYMLNVCARRPTAATVSAILWDRNPTKFGYVRPDTLALLLNLANVAASARVLVVETQAGIVTAAAAERLGGYGAVTTGYWGDKPPNIEAPRHFNFSERVRGTMHVMGLQSLLDSLPDPALVSKKRNWAQAHATDATTAATGGTEEPAAPAGDGQQDEIEGEVELEEMELPAGGPASSDPRSYPWAPPYTSAIIVAPGAHPVAMLRCVLPLLAPSATFAMAHPCLEPLAEAMDMLRREGRAVNMSLKEAWTREYQVLPQRTHPVNMMDHGGGYIFTGTVVLTEVVAPKRDGSAQEPQAMQQVQEGTKGV